MERRNWSLKALSELNYIDSLDADEKAQALLRWANDYLTNNKIEDFDLELKDLKTLEELFFKNINFLKKHKEETRQEILDTKKMQQFLKN